MIYFRSDEFDSPDEPGSGRNMQQSTLDKLNLVRRDTGIPMIINSGFRTVAHNRKVGGVNGSSHCKGHAVDVKCTRSDDRYAIIVSAIKHGFNRIGISHGFLHLDDDPDKMANLAFLY